MENLEHILRKTRLKWFGHVKRRNENSILRRAIEMEVEHHGRYGREQTSVEATHIMSNRSGKLGMLNGDDDNDLIYP